MNTFPRHFVVLAAMVMLTGKAGAQSAVTDDITSLQTSDSFVASTTVSVPGAGSGSFPTSPNNSITYSGDTTSITGFTASTVNYAPLNYSGTITTTLDAVTGTTVSTSPENNLLYNRITSQGTNTYTVASPYVGNEATAFNQNNLNVGTDNIFGNQGDGNGNNNNIERVDVVFNNGITATNALAFAVMERGVSNAHDTFQIAAITSINGSGAPTGYGSLIGFGTGTTFGSYGTTVLTPSTASTNWLVSRNATNGSGLPANDPSTVVNAQSIGGVTISVTQTGATGLGITAGTKIYGYSLFGFDVPANSTSAQLLNLTNQTTFPQNTSSTTGAGGIDLIAYTGVAFTAVPEPHTYGVFMLLGAALIWLGRRFRAAPFRSEIR